MQRILSLALPSARAGIDSPDNVVVKPKAKAPDNGTGTGTASAPVPARRPRGPFAATCDGPDNGYVSAVGNLSVPRALALAGNGIGAIFPDNVGGPGTQLDVRDVLRLIEPRTPAGGPAHSPRRADPDPIEIHDPGTNDERLHECVSQQRVTPLPSKVMHVTTPTAASRHLVDNDHGNTDPYTRRVSPVLRNTESNSIRNEHVHPAFRSFLNAISAPQGDVPMESCDGHETGHDDVVGARAVLNIYEMVSGNLRAEFFQYTDEPDDATPDIPQRAHYGLLKDLAPTLRRHGVGTCRLLFAAGMAGASHDQIVKILEAMES